MWKLMQAIVLFVTAGIVIARRFTDTLGFTDNPLLVVATGLGITTMLMYRSLVSLLVMVLFGMLISLPEQTLANYGLDSDMLLAFAIAALCLPWIQRLVDK